MSLRPYVVRYLIASAVLSCVFLTISWAVFWPLAGLGGLLAAIIAAAHSVDRFVSTTGRLPTGPERRRMIAAFIVAAAVIDVVPLGVYAAVASGGLPDVLARTTILLGISGSFACQMVWIWLTVRFYPEIVGRGDGQSRQNGR